MWSHCAKNGMWLKEILIYNNDNLKGSFLYFSGNFDPAKVRELAKNNEFQKLSDGLVPQFNLQTPGISELGFSGAIALNDNRGQYQYSSKNHIESLGLLLRTKHPVEYHKLGCIQLKILIEVMEKYRKHLKNKVCPIAVVTTARVKIQGKSLITFSSSIDI